MGLKNPAVHIQGCVTMKTITAKAQKERWIKSWHPVVTYPWKNLPRPQWMPGTRDDAKSCVQTMTWESHSGEQGGHGASNGRIASTMETYHSHSERMGTGKCEISWHSSERCKLKHGDHSQLEFSSHHPWTVMMWAVMLRVHPQVWGGAATAHNCKYRRSATPWNHGITYLSYSH